MAWSNRGVSGQVGNGQVRVDKMILCRVEWIG